MAELLLNGQPVALFSDGSAALGQTLFAADLHLGRDKDGQSSLAQGTEATLLRLSQRVDAAGAQRVVLLGDLWDSRSSLSDDVAAHLLQWRARHPQVQVVFIRGSHDRGGEGLMELLAIESMPSGTRLADIELLHYPPSEDPGRPWIAGHIHPGCRLPSAGPRDLLTPCFWHTLGGLTLPAFGLNVDASQIEPRPGDLVLAAAEGGLVRVEP